MNEYMFKQQPDNFTTLGSEGGFPNCEFLVWGLNLDKDNPLASATTMYNIPLELIPGTNVMVLTDEIEGKKYIIYSVQTDIPTL